MKFARGSNWRKQRKKAKVFKKSTPQWYNRGRISAEIALHTLWAISMFSAYDVNIANETEGSMVKICFVVRCDMNWLKFWWIWWDQDKVGCRLEEVQRLIYRKTMCIEKGFTVVRDPKQIMPTLVRAPLKSRIAKNNRLYASHGVLISSTLEVLLHPHQSFSFAPWRLAEPVLKFTQHTLIDLGATALATNQKSTL